MATSGYASRLLTLFTRLPTERFSAITTCRVFTDSLAIYWLQACTAHVQKMFPSRFQGGEVRGLGLRALYEQVLQPTVVVLRGRRQLSLYVL
jgi:hypothetical protein